MKLTLLALSLCMPLWAGKDENLQNSKTVAAKKSAEKGDEGMVDVPLDDDVALRTRKEPPRKKKPKDKDFCVIQ